MAFMMTPTAANPTQHDPLHMAQMILSKPLVIIVCIYQEMMRWLNRLLNGFVVGLWKDPRLKCWGKSLYF
jgi:hypothetical protein